MRQSTSNSKKQTKIEIASKEEVLAAGKNATRVYLKLNCDCCGVTFLRRQDQAKTTEPSVCGKCKNQQTTNKYSRKNNELHYIYVTLAHHLQWCTNIQNHSFKNYGAKGRSIHPDLRLGKDVKHNERAVEMVFEKLGHKPQPTAQYQFHVDWERSKTMSLDNIEWASTIKQNTEKCNTIRRKGKSVAYAAIAKGVSVKTVGARARANPDATFEEITSTGIRADIDRKKSLSLLKKLKALIRNGEIYASPDGDVFRIIGGRADLAQISSNHSSKYKRIKISRIGLVAVSWIVLAQYAPIPDDFTNKNFHYHADHINSNSTDNSVENLCWLKHSDNLQKRNYSIDESHLFVAQKVAEKEAIKAHVAHSLSPYTQKDIEKLRIETPTESSLTPLPSGRHVSREHHQYVKGLVSKLVEDDEVADLVFRFVLNPKNKAQFLEENVRLTDTKGSDILVSEINDENRSSFLGGFFIHEIVQRVPEYETYFEIPGSLFFVYEPKQFTIRGNIGRQRKDNTNYTLDIFAIPRITIPNSLAFKFPEAASLYVKNEDNSFTHPLLLNSGHDTKAFFNCAGCGAPVLERITPSRNGQNVYKAILVKKIIARTKNKQKSPLCESCLASKSRKNGSQNRA